MKARHLAWPVAAGLGALGYAVWETRAFTLRTASVPVLPAGSRPLRVLHLSDAHLTPTQHAKAGWLRSLANLQPDLVVNTGDNLSHRDALPALMRAYGALLDVPGVFVFGSNDYASPRPLNPLVYLRGGTGGEQERPRDLPFDQMRRQFVAKGWLDLNNAGGSIDIDGLRLGFVGSDDPHIGRDELSDVAPRTDVDLNLAVVHAPYLRVLDHWNALGYPLIFAGHTHGGQLCVPGYGALVTNCDLDPARAKGLHQHAVGGHDPSWLHVSAGLGTNPYTPFRFACRPEATLLTLTTL